MTAPSVLPALLLSLPLVLTACWAGGVVGRRLGQPPVIGEIAAGLLLGPSLLGHVWPAASAVLLPPALVPVLDTLGQLGLLCFMFLLGRELDPQTVRTESRTAGTVALAGLAVPLLCGALLALPLYGPYAPKGAGRLPFTLFLAVALSITAFPVLARILTDRGLTGTRLGALALTCAALADVLAWTLLALVAALARSASPLVVLGTFALTVAFAAAMLCVVRPLLARFLARARPGPAATLVLLLGGLCLSALATDHLGIHAIFGAFLFGAATPRDAPTLRQATCGLAQFTVPFLLPLFFVSTGLRTDIGTLGPHLDRWLLCAAILLVAGATKWGGTALVARTRGLEWRDALALGALMNCRGLTELIALTTGRELGLLSPELFTMLVLVALSATALTAPALTALMRDRAPARDREPRAPDASPKGRESLTLPACPPET
ncbi:cation:proton antiporter [Streptomyces sp. NPDC021749]|uniref:cation:proton antiporter domain-containing protein n=1 Tax=Streptomyces sp. NPDC021749 TaxID=3154905 RepID=UPI0034012D2C